MLINNKLTTLSIAFIAVRLCSGTQSIETLWYKPHYQCDGSDGSTPGEAASFINSYVSESSTMDFVGISEWVVSNTSIPVGNPEIYGSIGSVCGYDCTSYRTPVVLFFRRESWILEASYTPSQECQMVPVQNPCLGWTSDWAIMHRQDRPRKQFLLFYITGNDMGQNVGQRPWAAGLFRWKDRFIPSESDLYNVCVVVGEFPHPLANQTLYDFNGDKTADPRPFSIMRYICTNFLETEICVPNEDKSSYVFGTSVFTKGVVQFCGDKVPIIFIADTNVGSGDFFTSALFNSNDYSNTLTALKGAGGLSDALNNYTCCNDTEGLEYPFYGKGYNR